MQTIEGVSSAHRNVWIDCLRGVCILLVLCSHGLFNLPSAGSTTSWFSSAILGKGYFGVAAFFVISGFLITGNTLRRYGEPAKINFGQFYAMRMARILPCLLLFIAIMVPLGYSSLTAFHSPDKQELWGAVYAALTFQYNSYYLATNAPSLRHWDPLWSLSIEEIFYLTFPLVCFFLRQRTVLAILLAGLMVGGPLARKDYAGIFGFWGAADLLATGCLAALAADYFRPRLSKLGWPLLGIGGAVIGYIFTQYQVRENFTLLPTVLGLGTALFLLGASVAQPVLRPNFAVAVVATLGRVSYEIYIFHVALILMLKPAGLALLRWLGAPEFLAHLATSVVVLALIYWCCSALARFVTEPLNAGIRRFALLQLRRANPVRQKS